MNVMAACAAALGFLLAAAGAAPAGPSAGIGQISQIADEAAALRERGGGVRNHAHVRMEGDRNAVALRQHGAGHEARITVQGTEIGAGAEGPALVLQRGSFNSAEVRAQGGGHHFHLAQDGLGNAALLDQQTARGASARAHAHVRQTGADNVVAAHQVTRGARDLRLHVTQNGSENLAASRQRGSGHEAWLAQGGDGNTALFAQVGHGTTIGPVIQDGNGLDVRIELGGGLRAVAVTQRGAAPPVSIGPGGTR